MRCCVTGCKNDSKSQGITFHEYYIVVKHEATSYWRNNSVLSVEDKFPVEPSLRSAWLRAFGMDTWKPRMESSVVCSEHFIIQDSADCEYGDPDSLMVCRICLAVESKLFPMRKYKLEQAYENLTGVSAGSERSKLPQKLCAECAQRLLNCARFRSKSLRANSLLTEVIRKQGEITLKNLKTKNRENNQLQSSLEYKIYEPDHYDLYHYDDTEIKETSQITETEEITNDHVIYEIFDDEIPELVIEATEEKTTDLMENDLFTIENDNDKINTEIYENNDNIDDVNYIANESSTDDEFPRGFLRNMKALPKIKIKNYVMTIENDNDNVNSEIEDNHDNIDNDDHIANNSSTDDELFKGVIRNRFQGRKSRKNQNNNNKKEKSKEPKIDKRKKPVFNDRLSDTFFTISNLTYKEQVAEFAKKKESSLYKNAVFKCDECFRGFVHEDAYNAHMARHTNESGEYRCDVCKTHYKRPSEMKYHKRKCHAHRFSCKKCPFTTTHRLAARQHEMWHKGSKYSCPYCKDEFSIMSTYMLHIRVKHPSDFVCQLCGYSFVSEKGIYVHKILKHRQDKDIEIPEDGPNCEKCNIRFIDSAALTRHISVSTLHTDLEGKKRAPNISPVLKKRDPRPKGEMRKVRRSRRAEEPISCEQCGVLLQDFRAYNSHFRRVHPDKNRTKYPSIKSTPCMCEVCGRMCQSFHALKDHRRTHTGERPFSCEDCGKSFPTKTGLDTHIKVHSAEKKTHQCQVCLKHFSTRSNLQRHIDAHTGLKPIKCEICGKGFQFLCEKKDHIAYAHMKKPWPKRIRGKTRVGPKQNKTPENMPKNR